MLADLKRESEKIGLNMNIDKTKLLTPDRESQRIHIFRTHHNTGYRRIRLTWAAVGKLGTTLRNPTLPINLKKKVFKTCVLSVLTYGIETMTLIVKSANRQSKELCWGKPKGSYTEGGN